MPTVYLYVLETMADWEPSFLLAELVSGRFFHDRNIRFTLVLCGKTRDPVFSMGVFVWYRNRRSLPSVRAKGIS